MIENALAWLLFEALALEVGGVRYVVDWEGVTAIASATAALLGFAALYLSVKTLRQQLLHQTELEAKQLEKQLLLQVMELVDEPYQASQELVLHAIAWQIGGSQRVETSSAAAAAQRVTDRHHRFSAATAAALAVLRRSRPRRFPRGVEDAALQRYEDLIMQVLRANKKMLQYGSNDWNGITVDGFQSAAEDAATFANFLRRFTGELLARMFSGELEWAPIKFGKLEDAPTGSLVGFQDDDQLGRG